MGQWIGYGQYVRDRKEIEGDKKVFNYHYISKTRLINNFGFTNKLIKDYLPKPRFIYYSQRTCTEVMGWKRDRLRKIFEGNKELQSKVNKINERRMSKNEFYSPAEL